MYWIIAAVCLLLLILMAPLRLSISYQEEWRIHWKFLWYSRPFWKKKKKETKKLSYRRFEKLKARARAKKSTAKKSTQKKKKASLSFEDVLFLLREGSTLLQKLSRALFRRMTIRIHRLSLSVASEDAAKTAILYGAAIQSVAYLLQIADTVSHVSVPQPKHIQIQPDFLSTETKVSFRLSLQARTYQALFLFLLFFLQGTKFMTRWVQRRASEMRVPKHQNSNSNGGTSLCPKAN